MQDWYWVWYGWREFRPHQGSLSGEAWFGAPLVTGEESRLGKKTLEEKSLEKGRTGRGGLSVEHFSTSLNRGHFLAG